MTELEWIEITEKYMASPLSLTGETTDYIQLLAQG